MKRIFMWSLVLALVLVSSSAFAVQQDFPGMLGEVTIGVNVPANWNAVRQTTANTANDATVPCIRLTDKSDANRWFMVFLADELNANGTSLTLRQVGNNMLSAYGNRNSQRIDDGSTNGYYCFEYFVNNGVAQRFIFTDSAYDSRIKQGRYLTYQFSYDTLEPAEVEAIISSVTIDGQSRGGPNGGNGGGQSGETGGRTDSDTGTGTVAGSGGGGGGCDAGTGALALLAVCAAFTARKSR